MNKIELDNNARTRPNYTRRLLWGAAGSLVVLLLGSRPASGQFGFDIGVIIAGLETLNSTMQSTIGGPMSAIQTITGSVQNYESTIVTPMSGITSLQSSAMSLIPMLQGDAQTITSFNPSATLPATAQLESTSTSGDPNQVNNVASSYAAVYGAPLQTGSVDPQTQNIVDAADSASQDSIKKSMQLDAVSTREMEEASSLMSQAATVAPGNAGMLNAQASSWILQAQAYTQMGQAQLLRLDSVSVANQAAATKAAAMQGQNTLGNTNNLLGTAKP